MSSNRHGNRPARPFGATGGGFAKGQNNPEEFVPDETVGGFASGQDDQENHPEDVKLGSFARGQQAESHIHEGTFGNKPDEEEEK